MALCKSPSSWPASRSAVCAGDRRSVLMQWGKPAHEALQQETLLGREVIKSGETVHGASRFNAGAGRHGDFAKI